MSVLNNRIPPPVLVLIIAAAMSGVARLGTGVPLGLVPRLAIGAAVAGIGLAFVVLGFRAFQRARTTIDPVHIDRATSLVSGGIFRVSRNPMYVGFAAMLLGWGVVLGGAWALLGPLVFVVYITRFQIMPEERAMQEKFGGVYEEYRSRTRRWL